MHRAEDFGEEAKRADEIKLETVVDYCARNGVEKEEILRAVRADQDVINFLTNCGNKNLQYLLVPSRLEAALAVLDTDRDGTIDAIEWCVPEPETLWRL